MKYKKRNGSRSFQRKSKNLTRGRLRAIENKTDPDYPKPIIFPEVRRRITIECMEGGHTKHIFELLDTKDKKRVDSYYISVDGEQLYKNRRGKIVKTQTRDKISKGWSKAMRFAESFFVRVGRFDE